MITFLFSLYSVQFIRIRLRELTHMSPMVLLQSRVRELPLARVSRLCGLAASTLVVVKGALPDAPLLRSGVYLGGDLPLYHPVMGQLRTHQAALRSMAPLQVSFSCAGWPQFPFLVNFVAICVWEGSLPFRWEVVPCCSLTCTFLMACVLCC